MHLAARGAKHLASSVLLLLAEHLASGGAKPAAENTYGRSERERLLGGGAPAGGGTARGGARRRRRGRVRRQRRGRGGTDRPSDRARVREERDVAVYRRLSYSAG